MADQLFRLIASLDSHFAADDQLPADAARWREFTASARGKHALLALLAQRRLHGGAQPGPAGGDDQGGAAGSQEALRKPAYVRAAVSMKFVSYASCATSNGTPTCRA
jgi:hypothetical protein